MSEPEDVLLEGAHAATTFVSRLWRRHVPGPPRVQLGGVRHRLEVLLGALFGEAPSIVPAEPAARPSFAGRIARRIPRHMIDEREHPSTDGGRIRLPRAIEARAGRDAVLALYRMMAVQQGARAARGTARIAPSADGTLHRDLFLLCEAAAVDRWLATELPGMVAELSAARRRALALRPERRLLTDREWEVERLLRALLESHPSSPATDLGLAASEHTLHTPHDSLEWAAERAALASSVRGRYRGLPPVEHWGRVDEPQPGRRKAVGPRDGEEDRRIPSDRLARLRRRPRVRDAADDEDDSEMGMLMIQLDDPQEHAEDPMGLQRPADRDAEKNTDDLADSFSELPEARMVTTPAPSSEVLSSDDPPPRRSFRADERSARLAYAYPEWDYRIGAYHEAHAMVREVETLPGDAGWVREVLGRHAREIAQVRHRFERLRPQRLRLARQLDGSDVDVAAYTLAHADLRAGHGGEDRLYETVRPVRRDIAVSLLVDVSGSTDGWLSDRRRIIDVEKEAVLLVCEALDALGDRYSVNAFSGEGPGSVAMHVVKRFDERYGEGVRLRIAGLEHDRYTRMGAALRHATALLCRERARHQLLLMLTDGRPNDVDLYEGRYGIEDTRQAVAEARLQGVHPFCLTVDREAPSYMPRLFGPAGYSVLRRAETLPQALVEVVRRLLKG